MKKYISNGFITNGVTFRKPRGTDLVTASELIPGFRRSKANVPTPPHDQKPDRGDSLRHQMPAPCPHFPPTGFTLIGAYYSFKIYPRF